MLGCSLYYVLFVKEFPSEFAMFLGVNPPDCLEVLFCVAVSYLEGCSSLLCGIPRKQVIFPLSHASYCSGK